VVCIIVEKAVSQFRKGLGKIERYTAHSRSARQARTVRTISRDHGSGNRPGSQPLLPPQANGGSPIKVDVNFQKRFAQAFAKTPLDAGGN